MIKQRHFLPYYSIIELLSFPEETGNNKNIKKLSDG
jgi:hypothetical protein